MITTRASTTDRIFHLVFLSSWVGLLANPCYGFASASFPSSPSVLSTPAFSTSLAASATSSPNTTTPSSSADSGWKPKIESLEDRRSLRGQLHDSEIIGTKSFHHVEFYCGDARSAANHFAISLGMSITGTTSQATGNDKCVSYGLESGENFRLLLTAPYSRARASSESEESENDDYDAPLPMPNYSVKGAHKFFQKHGLAARAVGVEVEDAKAAFDASVAKGAVPVLEPSFLPTCPAQIRASSSDNNNSGCYIAEVELYGDVVLRYVSFPKSENGDRKTSSSNSGDSTTTTRPFLSNLAPVEKSTMRESYGIYRIDHAVGNVHDLQETYSRIRGFTGFHEFAEFTSEDVGTVDSGLNSVVLASDSEEVLLPINEPTNGR